MDVETIAGAKTKHEELIDFMDEAINYFDFLILLFFYFS